MEGSTRMTRGSACRACHRLKMKCFRPSGSLSCSRCQKNSRVCLPSVVNGVTTSQAPRLDRVPEPLFSNSIGTADIIDLGPTILPSIYTACPAAVLADRHQGLPYAQDGLSIPKSTDAPVISHAITGEQTSQLIEYFRERLLWNIPMLNPADFSDLQHLIARSRHLVSCVSYVTAQYIPGYRDVGDNLTAAILDFLQMTYTAEMRNEAEEVATMQALIIICAFTRWTVVQKRSSSRRVVDFYYIKATTETFARRIHLHHSATRLKRDLTAGNTPSKYAFCTTRYMYWLWLYTLSHHTSIVTGTPPSLQADASIRSASKLLACLASHEDVSILLNDVQLCLLWDQLGVKDISVKEWWCSTDLQYIKTNSARQITFQDVDLALDEWKAQSSPTRNNSTNILRLNPDYHFHYTRFCLNTYFINHIRHTDLQPDEINGIRRCTASATSVLDLFQHLDPIMRDQLRYSSGFVYITVAYCSAYILEALRRFPTLFSQPARELTLLSDVANLLYDLGGDKVYGPYAFGLFIMRQVEMISQLIHVRRGRPPSQADTLANDAGASNNTQVGEGHHIEVAAGNDSWEIDINSPAFDSIFDFPSFFNGYVE